MLRRAMNFFTRKPPIINGLQTRTVNQLIRPLAQTQQTFASFQPMRQQLRPVDLSPFVFRGPQFRPIRRHFFTTTSKDFSLHHAVEGGKLQKVKELIQSGSERLLLVNEKGYTPLHLAAEFGNYEMLSLIMTALGDRAIRVTKMVTNHGLLPIQLLDRNEHVKKGCMDTFLMYEALIMRQMQIHPKVVVKTYAKTEPFYENLKIADEVLKKVADMKIQSGTNPDNNNLDLYHFEDIEREVSWVRCLYQAPKFPDLKASFEACVNAVVAKKFGNCGEISDVVAMELIKLGKQPEVFGVYHIDDCHGVAVIGRDPASDPADYKTWGDEAVVIDGQKGIRYPAKDIPLYLTSFWRWENSDSFFVKKNIHVEFNPHFNRLIRKYHFQVTKPSEYQIAMDENLMMTLKAKAKP
jgi:hypothetical protein